MASSINKGKRDNRYKNMTMKKKKKKNGQKKLEEMAWSRVQPRPTC